MDRNGMWDDPKRENLPTWQTRNSYSSIWDYRHPAEGRGAVCREGFGGGSLVHCYLRAFCFTVNTYIRACGVDDLDDIVVCFLK